MMDRDLMMNLVAASSDNHMRFIDDREDLLMTRANKWREALVEGTNEWVQKYICIKYKIISLNIASRGKMAR